MNETNTPSEKGVSRFLIGGTIPTIFHPPTIFNLNGTKYRRSVLHRTDAKLVKKELSIYSLLFIRDTRVIIGMLLIFIAFALILFLADYSER